MKINLLVLGASGGVGKAFIQLLAKKKEFFSQIVLVDKVDRITDHSFIQSLNLPFTFIEGDASNAAFLEELFTRGKISHVIDLTDGDTEPLLLICDKTGIAYYNCSLNPLPPVDVFVDELKRLSERYTNAKHVISLGMNPGLINHFFLKGIQEYGRPKEFVEIEFDSGIYPKEDASKPFITWSPFQFLYESAYIRTGLCNSEGEFYELEKSAIYTTEDTEKYLKPVMGNSVNFPRGMIVPHDEIIMLAHDWKVPGKFVYAIHPQSLELLQEGFHGHKHGVLPKDMIFEENTTARRLSGSDTIGMWMYYEDKSVLYYYSVNHEDIHGTNATLYLVAVGAISGLLASLEDKNLQKRVNFVSDLDTNIVLDIASEFVPLHKIEI